MAKLKRAHLPWNPTVARPVQAEDLVDNEIQKIGLAADEQNVEKQHKNTPGHPHDTAAGEGARHSESNREVGDDDLTLVTRNGEGTSSASPVRTDRTTGKRMVSPAPTGTEQQKPYLTRHNSGKPCKDRPEVNKRNNNDNNTDKPYMNRHEEKPCNANRPSRTQKSGRPDRTKPAAKPGTQPDGDGTL